MNMYDLSAILNAILNISKLPGFVRWHHNFSWNRWSSEEIDTPGIFVSFRSPRDKFFKHLLLHYKQRIDYKLCLLTYKTLTNQQPTYLYNSLSFPSHSVSTRSSDSLVLSIPYVRSSLGKRAFSVIGPRLWNSLYTSWYPKFEFSTNFPFQAQNTPLQNCIPSLY